jgi:hypothetical protein
MCSLRLRLLNDYNLMLLFMLHYSQMCVCVLLLYHTYNSKTGSISCTVHVHQAIVQRAMSLHYDCVISCQLCRLLFIIYVCVCVCVPSNMPLLNSCADALAFADAVRDCNRAREKSSSVRLVSWFAMASLKYCNDME